MFSRSRQKFVAWIALVAVMWATLAPTSFAGATNAVPNGMGDICSALHGAGAGGGGPRVPTGDMATHDHCGFCNLIGPSLAAHAPLQILVRLAPPAADLPSQADEALPPHRIALYPLSPRAPPRVI